MSEKMEVNTSRDFCKTPEQLRQQLSDMNESEIMQMLSDWTEHSYRSGEELPPELVMTFYDVLDELAPLEPMPFDFQTSWKRFTKEHPELISQEKGEDTIRRKWTSSRKLKYLVSFAAIAILCISAYAMDVPTAVYFWGQDLLHLQPISGTMSFVQISGSEYTSLADALNANGINVMLPTWIPSAYYLDELSVEYNHKIIYFNALYSSDMTDERPLFIRVIAYPNTNDIPDIYYERTANERHTEYTFNGYNAVLSSNNSIKRASWVSKNCAISISGTLSDFNLKRILHSIKEESSYDT